jgi:hypothetical protein
VLSDSHKRLEQCQAHLISMHSNGNGTWGGQLTLWWLCPMVTKGWMIMQCRRVEEWAKIEWISLLESGEVVLVISQYNVPDLQHVNGWRRGLLETLLRLSFEWDVFCKKRLQMESLWGSVGFGYLVVMSCIEIWVDHKVIMTEVQHSRPQL